MNGGPQTRSRSALTLVAAAIVLALSLDCLLDGDRVPYYRDLLFFFVPFKHFLAEHLRRGEAPLWNPGVFMGTPFLGSLQTCVLYPPSLLLLLPFPLGFNVFLLAHYLIALAGAYLLLRDRDLSFSPSAIGALVFSAGGFLISLLNLANHLQGAAWAPWMLLTWCRLTRKRSGSALLSFALVTVLEILAGSPETVLMTLAILAAWTVAREGSSWLDAARRLALLGALLTLGLGLTAFQILPTLEYLHASVRNSGFSFEEATQWSFEPISLLQLLLPHTAPPHLSSSVADLGFEAKPPWIVSVYFGLVPLCLAVVGAAFGRERRLWGTLIIVAVLLALGRNSRLFEVLYSLAPWLLGKFRYPEKFLFVAHLSVAVLVGEGAQRLVEGQRGAIRIGTISAILLAAIGAALWCMRWTAPQAYLLTVAILTGRYGPFPAYVDLAADIALKAERLFMILGTFVVVVSLAQRDLLKTTAFALILALLVSGDLITAQRGLNPTLSWSELRSEPLLVDSAALRSAHERIFHYNTIAAVTEEPVPGLDQWWHVSRTAASLEGFIKSLWPTLFMNAGMVEGVANICGADGLDRDSDASLRRLLSVVPREISLKLLRLYAVRFLIGPVSLDSPAIERVVPREPSPFFVYRMREPLPLAYLATRLLRAPSERDAFNRLIAPDFQLGRDAVVSELPPDWIDAAAARSDPGEVEIVSYESDAVRLRAESKRRALLVLSDSDFPGWEATVDGRSVAIVRTNALVRGVALDAGSHLVEFRYRPASLRRGATISAVSLVTLAVIVVFLALRRPTQPTLEMGPSSQSFEARRA
jgi:hypothetical protein